MTYLFSEGLSARGSGLSSMHSWVAVFPWWFNGQSFTSKYPQWLVVSSMSSVIFWVEKYCCKSLFSLRNKSSHTWLNIMLSLQFTPGCNDLEALPIFTIFVHTLVFFTFSRRIMKICQFCLLIFIVECWTLKV